MSIYPGSGQAKLLRSNNQTLLWEKERVGLNKASLAVELERIKSSFYPWGAAIEIEFSGSPGTFQIDVQGSETDKDENYIKLASTAIINAVNANNVGRYDLGSPLYPKFVRLYTTTFPNEVLITARITR